LIARDAGGDGFPWVVSAPQNDDREAAMAQEQTQRQGGGDDGEGGDDATAAGQERREKLGEDVDSILDEIDDVLEENAEDFVRAYVQKGGQ
jgi:ubiquitin-like protein Pup